jgi:thioredoxin 1
MACFPTLVPQPRCQHPRMTTPYTPESHTRADIDALRGPAVLNFGTNWCGFCIAAQPLIDRALASHPDMPHVKVEDGSGRALGRSYRVKLWPTLVFLRDGQEVDRVVRPGDVGAIEKALARIAGSDTPHASGASDGNAGS